MSKINYTKMGRKNKTRNPFFMKICKMSQTELKAYLNKELSKYYKNVIARDGFLYAKGKDKVLLTAHMDTVHRSPIKDFYEFRKDNMTIVSSPQGIGGDDRCGVYIILQILRNTSYRPYILFCEDEETGCEGSQKFTETNFINDLKKMYFLIELDRKGKDEAVYYDDNNEEFEEFVKDTTGYEFDFGSMSDISILSPACKISSVNLSCGYYNQHTTDEYVILEEMDDTVKATEKMLKAGLNDKKQYEYNEKVYRYSRYSYGTGYGYGYGRDYGVIDGSSYSTYDDYFNAKYGYGVVDTQISDKKDDDDEVFMTLWASFTTKEGRKGEDSAYAADIDELWGIFFQNNPDVCFNDIEDYDIWKETTPSVLAK